MRRLNVLTWHTHGSYLYYLSHAPHDFHVLAKPGRPPGYGGRCGPFPFGPNVHDLPADQARTREFDCILFQEDHHWERDQYELLTPAQRALPRIYLEHDPPGLPVAALGDALVDPGRLQGLADPVRSAILRRALAARRGGSGGDGRLCPVRRSLRWRSAREVIR